MRLGSSLASCPDEDPEYARDSRFPNHSVAKVAASRWVNNVSEKLRPANIHPNGVGTIIHDAAPAAASGDDGSRHAGRRINITMIVMVALIIVMIPVPFR